MIKVLDKYKIKKEYRDDILQSLQMAYDNIDDNIVNKIWIIDGIDEIYKNKDLSYFDLDEVMFSFKY
jgi:lysine/ornithine N-monooxygenase